MCWPSAAARENTFPAVCASRFSWKGKRVLDHCLHVFSRCCCIFHTHSLRQHLVPRVWPFSPGKLVQNRQRQRQGGGRWCFPFPCVHKFVCMIGSNNFICLRLCSLANRQWPVSQSVGFSIDSSQLRPTAESRHSYAPTTADFVAPSLFHSLSLSLFADCTGKCSQHTFNLLN